MEKAIETQSKPAPYGLLGLCLSLIVALLLTLVFMGLTVAAAYLAVKLLRGAGAALAAEDAVITALRAATEFNAAHLILGMLFYVAALAALLLVARWRGGAGWRRLVAWSPPFSPWHGKVWRDKVLWVLAGVGLVYGLAASAALGYLYPKSNSWLLVPRDHVSAALLFFLAVVVAPIVEETYFRGWIFTSLRVHWGRWPAIVVSSLLFALAHYESTHLYALAVFPLGLVLAGVRERTGSARTSMLFHAANNLIACLSAGIAGS